MHQSSLDNMEKVIKELAPYLDKENDIFDLGGGGKLERSYKGLWQDYTKEYCWRYCRRKCHTFNETKYVSEKQV